MNNNAGLLSAGPVFKWNYNSTKRITINRGGTRSGKTYSLSQLAVLWLMTGRISTTMTISKGVLSVVRKTLPSLKATVLRDIEEIMHNMGVMNMVSRNKTNNTFTYQGRTLEYFSVDDQQKVRSRKRAILICIEANELTWADMQQMLFRTTDKVLIDFNPDDVNSWIKTKLEDERQHTKSDVEIIVSSYKDNPFLTQGTIEEIEYLEETDPELWKIFGLGEYGTVTGLIFPNTETINEWPKDCEKEFYGLDFGFTNDPTALVRIGVKGKNIYLDECLYNTGLTDDELEDALIVAGIESRQKIWADQAEPKSIAYLKKKGFRITGADKGPDSIRRGITLVKSYKIHIMASAVNMQKEQRSYKWKVDKNGDAQNVPIDKFNHLWDAVRYGCIMELRGDSKKISNLASVKTPKRYGTKQKKGSISRR